MSKPNKPVKVLVVLADLHLGSSKALLPPGFTTIEGNEIKLNLMQEWLWDCWRRSHEWIGEVVGDDPFALILNGDLIEGIHHGTKEIISPSVDDHVAAAIEVISPLSSLAAKTVVIRGTECHVSNTENVIGKVLGAVVNPDLGTHAFDRATIDMNGVRHVFRHHIGSSIRRGLAATQLSVNLAEEQLEAVNNGEAMPQVVGVAHRHQYGQYKNDNGIIIVSPPWQGLTRFGHKVVSQSRTKPGLYIIDARGKSYGELPEIRTKLFTTPRPEAIGF